MSRSAVLPRWQAALLWIGAIGFGAIGVVGTRSYIADSLQTEKAKLAGAQRTVATVVAKQDLPVGSTVGPQTMAVRQMPQSYLPTSAILADQFDRVAGMQLRVAMAGGQALLETAVTQSAPGFSERVGHGIRAMTVAVDEVNSVSGMLSPGDRIDLLFSTRPPTATGQVGSEVTAPLMQDLLVLATGQQTNRQTESASSARFATITVEVTPDQAQRLVLAQSSGRLTALLRNPKDRREQVSAPMDVYTLLGIARPSPAAVAPPAGPEVIVGGLGPVTEISKPAGVPYE